MVTNIILKTSKQDIPITIIRSNRKTIGFEIRDCKVSVRVPNVLTDKEVEAFIKKHQDWIITHYEKALEQSQEADDMFPDLATISKSEEQAICKKFGEKVYYYANLMGVTYSKVTIRNQKTRWGSCSSKGNLNFNYKLYYMPEELMDYVIVHELAHRKFMNHSAEFWKEVETYCPSYKQCRKELRQNYE